MARDSQPPEIPRYFFLPFFSYLLPGQFRNQGSDTRFPDITGFLAFPPEKKSLTFAFCGLSFHLMELNRELETQRFKQHYGPLGEGQISLILANGAFFGLIICEIRNGRFYGLFLWGRRYQDGNRSPKWAYFPSTQIQMILRYFTRSVTKEEKIGAQIEVIPSIPDIKGSQLDHN